MRWLGGLKHAFPASTAARYWRSDYASLNYLLVNSYFVDLPICIVTQFPFHLIVSPPFLREKISIKSDFDNKVS